MHCVLRLLPGISSLLISTLPVHSPAFFPKPLPIFPIHSPTFSPNFFRVFPVSHLMRIQNLKVLLLKPGVGQYKVIHATLTDRDFFLSLSTFLVYSPAFFSQPLPIFPVLAVANTWFLCRPAEQNRSHCQRQVPVLSTRGI